MAVARDWYWGGVRRAGRDRRFNGAGDAFLTLTTGGGGAGLAVLTALSDSCWRWYCQRCRSQQKFAFRRRWTWNFRLHLMQRTVLIFLRSGTASIGILRTSRTTILVWISPGMMPRLTQFLMVTGVTRSMRATSEAVTKRPSFSVFISCTSPLQSYECNLRANPECLAIMAVIKVVIYWFGVKMAVGGQRTCL